MFCTVENEYFGGFILWWCERTVGSLYTRLWQIDDCVICLVLHKFVWELMGIWISCQYFWNSCFVQSKMNVLEVLFCDDVRERLGVCTPDFGRLMIVLFAWFCINLFGNWWEFESVVNIFGTHVLYSQKWMFWRFYFVVMWENGWEFTCQTLADWWLCYLPGFA